MIPQRNAQNDCTAIFWSKIAKRADPAVGVVEADYELLEDPARLLLRQPPMGAVA